MKKSNLLFIVIICIFAGILSCEDTRLDYITAPSVYIPKSGEIEQIVYKTGEPYIYRLGIYKSGGEEVLASATVGIMSEAELQAYNSENNTSYKRLPDNSFQMKGGGRSVQVNFPKTSRLEFAEIDILYGEIEKLPDYDSENSMNYVIPVMLSQSDIQIGEEKKVSLINILLKDPLLYFRESESSLQVESSDVKYAQTIDLVVDFPNTWDISSEVGVDEEAIEEYNEKNGTELKLLPDAAYSLSPNPLIINKGENFAKLTVTLNNGNIDYDNFLLPIAIKSVSKFSADTERNIHYLLVSRPAHRLDRTGWTIADFSSEEVSGEGDGQGVAACVLDGDASTFWHNQWEGGTGQLPHHITIDMQKEVTVTNVDLQRRKNNRDTYRGNFFVSSDNESFTKVGTFEMAEVNEPQSFKVNTTRGRYFKLEITESRKPPHANMAELYVRGIE